MFKLMQVQAETARYAATAEQAATVFTLECERQGIKPPPPSQIEKWCRGAMALRAKQGYSGDLSTYASTYPGSGLLAPGTDASSNDSTPLTTASAVHDPTPTRRPTPAKRKVLTISENLWQGQRSRKIAKTIEAMERKGWTLETHNTSGGQHSLVFRQN